MDATSPLPLYKNKAKIPGVPILCWWCQLNFFFYERGYQQLWFIVNQNLNKAPSVWVLSMPRVPRLQRGLGHIWDHCQGNLSAKHFSGGDSACRGDSPQLRGTEQILHFSPLDLFLYQTALRASVDPPLRALNLSCCDQVGGTKCHNLQEMRWKIWVIFLYSRVAVTITN